MSDEENVYGRAEAALRRSDTAEVERVLTAKWPNLANAPGEAQHIMAMAYLAKLDGARAVQFMRAAVRAEPKSLRHHIALGHILSSSGDHAGAADAYAAAAQIDPNWPGVHFVLSVASYKAGRHAEAETAARAAVQANPIAETWDALASAMRALGNGQEALAASDEALKLDRDDINAINGRGAALLMLNRPGEALEVFESLFAKGVNAPVLALNRAAAYDLLGRTNEARAIYDDAQRRWAHLPNLQQQIAARRR